MAMFELHPGLILLTGALLAIFLPARLRQTVMLLAPVLALISLFSLQNGTVWNHDFINGLTLTVLKVDGLSWVFALIFTMTALLSNVYALRVKNGGESAAGMAYAGAALGVVFAGDWLTLFFFWELMTVSSIFLIWYRKTPSAIRAGLRYILVHFFGGNLLLAGIFLKVTSGQVEVGVLTGTNDAAFWLILLGISVNTAIPPLHAWLTDAYPEGTITGSVFLSAFTTKVAVYCLIRIFPGVELLIWAGVIMTLYGVIYAVIENDIRRLLSYHIVSQVGFMVAAVGIGTELALNGAVAHAYSHILYKSLLFMSAGAVIYATGKSKLSDLGGLYKQMPLVAILFIIGAFSISGVPLFNGYISKSMITSAAAAGYLPVAERLLYLASIGTFLSICLKLSYFMFFAPSEKRQKVEKVPINMLAAMSMGAFLCFLYGIIPSMLYQYLPFNATYNPFTWEHAISTIQLQVAALVIFVVFIKKLGVKPKMSLDTDWLYRKPLNYFIFAISSFVTSFQARFGVFGFGFLGHMVHFFSEPVSNIQLDKLKDDIFCPIYGKDHYWFPVGAIVFTVLVMLIIVFTCAVLM